MEKFKKPLFVLISFAILISLSSCTRMSNDHSKIEKYIKNRYSDDKLTYESTGLLNWYTGIDEFYMYSANLNDKFKVVAKNWKTENPIIEDNYISKKYTKQVEEMYLNLLNDYIEEIKIGQLDCSNILIDSNNIDVNISFDDWWNNYGKHSSVFIMALAKNINYLESSPLYRDEDHSVQVYQTTKVFEKLKENNLCETPTHIIWLDEHSYFLNFSDIIEGSTGYKTYFALSYMALEDKNDFNTYKLKWFDELKNEWIETDNPTGKRMTDIISDIKLKDELKNKENIENTENDTTSNNSIIDTDNIVIMPDPDELQKKIEEGEKVIYNPSFS